MKDVRGHRPLMVVFEGPDCTGKTTIVHRLMDERSCPMTKRVRTPDRFTMLSDIIGDINQQMLRTSCGSGESLIVFDRWQMVSDIVYEKYCYNTPSILEPLYPDLARACLNANILVLFMTVTEEAMIKRFEERGDRLRTLEEAILVRQKYYDFFNRGVGKLLWSETVDTTDKSIEEVYQKVLKIINFYEREDRQ